MLKFEIYICEDKFNIYSLGNVIEISRIYTSEHESSACIKEMKVLYKIFF